MRSGCALALGTARTLPTNESKEQELDKKAALMHLLYLWLAPRVKVAWGAHGGGFGVVLVEPWWSLGGALVEPWWSLGVALGWLWGPNRLAINRLWCGFEVALYSGVYA